MINRKSTRFSADLRRRAGTEGRPELHCSQCEGELAAAAKAETADIVFYEGMLVGVNWRSLRPIHWVG
jgi:hypothetical protein